MSTKRKRIPRSMRRNITPEILAAYRAGDSVLLNRLLGVRPWQQGPLEVVDDDHIVPDPTPITPRMTWDETAAWARSVLMELQDADEAHTPRT